MVCLRSAKTWATLDAARDFPVVGITWEQHVIVIQVVMVSETAVQALKKHVLRVQPLVSLMICIDVCVVFTQVIV